MAKTSELIDPIEQATDAVRIVQQSTYTEAELPDIVGRLHMLERFVASTRKNLEAEVGPEAVGGHYQAETSRKASRTYNTNGLLMAFHGEFGDVPLDVVIRRLMDDDVLRLAWRWTQLQKAAADHDVTLTIAKHEIADGDPDALIGEVWDRTTRVVAKPEPEVVT